MQWLGDFNFKQIITNRCEYLFVLPGGPIELRHQMCADVWDMDK